MFFACLLFNECEITGNNPDIDDVQRLHLDNYTDINTFRNGINQVLAAIVTGISFNRNWICPFNTHLAVQNMHIHHPDKEGMCAGGGDVRCRTLLRAWS